MQLYRAVEAVRGAPAQRDWLGPVALTALLCVIGIWWGWTEIWNPDQMMFKDPFREGHLPFSPERFFKPPLLTYISLFLVKLPAELISRSVEWVTGTSLGYNRFIDVWFAKVLHLGFACGSIYLLHRCARAASERRSAITITLLLATSAGFVVQAHLRTTDLPLVFMMIAAFACAQRLTSQQRLRTYLLAGVMVGLAGAMKYNGLAAAAAIPAFHAAATLGRTWREMFLSPKLIASGGAIVGGFVLGNPFAVIEYRRFLSDLRYSTTVSPVYSLDEEPGSESANVFAILPEDLLGWPLFLTLIAAIAVSVVMITRRRSWQRQATAVAALAVILLYLAYFGTRSLVHVRWMLATVPFLLLASVPCWDWLFSRAPRISRAWATVLVLYGAVCSLHVGIRFASDPRMAAVAWMRSAASSATSVESSPNSPKWELQFGVRVNDVRMPRVSGRRRLFEATFPDRPEILAKARELEPEDGLPWYRPEALDARAPDMIAVNSLDYARYEGRLGQLYPEMKSFYARLLAGELGYRPVFDQQSRPVPRLLYPRNIEYLDNRMVVLARVPQQGTP